MEEILRDNGCPLLPAEIAVRLRERGFRTEMDYDKLRSAVVRKQIDVLQGQLVLFHNYGYFFYITNDWDLSPAEVVFEANDRCDQENLHAQLLGSVRALHAPIDNLVSHWPTWSWCRWPGT